MPTLQASPQSKACKREFFHPPRKNLRTKISHPQKNKPSQPHHTVWRKRPLVLSIIKRPLFFHLLTALRHLPILKVTILKVVKSNAVYLPDLHVESIHFLKVLHKATAALYWKESFSDKVFGSKTIS